MKSSVHGRKGEMLLLDLFCGAGGGAMGYRRVGFEVVGVDIEPQRSYPYPFVQMDALKAMDRLIAGGFLPASDGRTYRLMDFDAVHASPPCQGYIQRNKNLETKWPKLIRPVRDRLGASGLRWVIENVPGAPLIEPFTLCGTMFSLPLLRHRLFETSFGLQCDLECNHWGTVADGDLAGVYAFGGKGRRRGRDLDGNRVRDAKNRPGPEWSVSMGIHWMTRYELTQAIPPAYTEWVGKRLLAGD